MVPPLFFMNVNFVWSEILISFFFLLGIHAGVVYALSLLSLKISRFLTLIQWKSLLLKQKSIVRQAGFQSLDKIPVITICIFMFLSNHITALTASFLSLAWICVRLSQTHDWQADSSLVERWRLESGLSYSSFSRKQTRTLSPFFVKLSASDMLLFENTLSHKTILILCLFLSLWCLVDVLRWKRNLISKFFSVLETSFILPPYFAFMFFKRLILLTLFLSLVYVSIGSSSYSFYILQGIILSLICICKVFRIWNETLLAQTNIQKRYHLYTPSGNTLFNFDKARLRMDIGLDKRFAQTPLVRLLMIRTLFDLSDKKMVLNIVGQTDLFMASFLLYKELYARFS
jgi:hypothetical protein